MLINVHQHPAYCYTGGKEFNAGLPCAVFIHGAQNDHSVWALQSRYFAHHGFSVLAPDLPGHGRSKGSALASVEEMAGWLLAVLDAAGVGNAMLVGHSMGSLIVLDAARQAPERVSKLAFLGTAFPMKVSDQLLQASLQDEPRAIHMVNVWSHSSIAQKPSFPGPGAWTRGGALRLKQRLSAINPAQLFHTDFSACNNYSNGLQAAASVRCPTLFMLGRRDMMTLPRNAAGLQAAIPHAQTLMLACGHEMMAEQPDAVLDGLFRFCRASAT